MPAANEDSRLAAKGLRKASRRLFDRPEESTRYETLAVGLESGQSIILPAAEAEALRSKVYNAQNLATEALGEMGRFMARAEGAEARLKVFEARNAALEKVAEAARAIHTEGDGDDTHWIGILGVLQALDKVPKLEGMKPL